MRAHARNSGVTCYSESSSASMHLSRSRLARSPSAALSVVPARRHATGTTCRVGSGRRLVPRLHDVAVASLGFTSLAICGIKCRRRAVTRRRSALLLLLFPLLFSLFLLLMMPNTTYYVLRTTSYVLHTTSTYHVYVPRLRTTSTYHVYGGC